MPDYWKNRDHTLEMLSDGVKALERLRQELFDALLIDWTMLKLDGITLIQNFRDEFEKAPLILMVTAIGDDDL